MPLRKFNNESEEFIYIVSHDLNAPLRHLREFTRLLFEGIGSDLDEREKRFVGIIQDSAREMEGMLSALLTYSRLNTDEKKPELIKVSELINDIVESHKNSKIKFNVKCDKSLEIEADKKLMSLLIKELVDNAIKFQNKNSMPDINIEAKKEKDNLVFSIKDNGIGNIPEDRRQEIFSVFKKLNSKLYPGVGIGLSLCKKIVETYRGEISVKSSDGNGSEFSFSIPLKQKK